MPMSGGARSPVQHLIDPHTKIIPMHVPWTAADHRDASSTVVDGWTPKGPEASGSQTAPRAYPVADSNHW
jgi:hypothetical protein